MLFIECCKLNKIETMEIKEILSDENIEQMADQYTSGVEDHQAFVLACNVIAKKLKLWEQKK